MLGGKCLRVAGALTLFFFVFFIISADFAAAKEKEEDILLKARRLYQEGDYEGSIKLLGDFITKLRAMVEQKRNVAEAFYLMAKIYFEVGDDAKVDENLRKVFETYPAFTKEEVNLGFKDRVEKIKEAVMLEKEKEPPVEEEQETVIEEEEPEVEPRVIPSRKPLKKKKKKFPVLLVLGGVAVIAAAILLLKKKSDDSTPSAEYDIRGDWTLDLDVLGEIITGYFNFSGSITRGTFVEIGVGSTGTYNVSGRSVTFRYDDEDFSFDGNFTDRNHMEGQFRYVTDDGIVLTGPWNGTRGISMNSATGSGVSLKEKAGRKIKN